MTNKIRFDLGRVRTNLEVEIRDSDELTVAQNIVFNAGSTNSFGAYIVTVPPTLAADAHYTAYLIDVTSTPTPVGVAHFYWDGASALEPSVASTRDLKIEADYSLADMLRIQAAALAGRCNQTGNTITFKGIDGTTDRIVATTTPTGDRTAVTIDSDV